MIHALRRRHGTLILAVTAVVPALAVLALVSRPSPPIMPAVSAPPSIESWTALDAEGTAHAMIESDGGMEWVHIVRGENLVAPDVLVYWAAATPVENAPISASAVFLGALGDVGPHSFDLPLRGTPGTLVLYSLGHRAVIAFRPVDQIRRLDRQR